MPDIPGLKADVFFGDTKELPDWRKELPPEEDTDDEEPTEEEIATVNGMLGFDSSELFDEEPTEDKETKTFDPEAGIVNEKSLVQEYKEKE